MTLIAKDQAGNATTVHVPVVVENVAPTANFVASAGSINEGGSVDFSFSDGSDASAVDMAAGLTYSFDFDGDGVFDVTGSSPSASHTFAQDGVYVVTRAGHGQGRRAHRLHGDRQRGERRPGDHELRPATRRTAAAP